MSVPQYLIVFYHIFVKKYQIAFLLHAVFIAACVSKGILIEGDVSPFLYINMRVYGPLTFNIIILVTLWFLVHGKTVQLSKKSLLLKTRNIFLYLLISGSVIGFGGCLFVQHYSWTYWVKHLLFVWEMFLFVDIFTHLYSEKFSKLFAIVVLCMMSAAPVASVVSFSLDVQAIYGNEVMALYNPILFISPCLIIALFQLKNLKLKMISLIGLVFYVLHSMILSRGSQFLDIFVALLLLGYLVYFKKSKNYQIKGLRLFLPVLIVGIVPLAINGVISSSDVSLNKFEQFTSLFNFIDFSNNEINFQYDEIGSSPYIRIGELANIIHEGTQNIFSFVFGNGFGGYYTDKLHFFSGLDLSRGAFSDESAASGYFYTAHSAIPSVLQYNGLICLVLMIWLAFSYLRKVDRSFLVYAAFVLLVQSFYFDMFGCFSFMMALFGAEYLMNGTTKEDAL